MNITIRTITKYQLCFNEKDVTDKQVIWYNQTIPRNTKLVTVTNFTGKNWTGSPPSTLLYDFIYLPCSDKPCDYNGFNGWLQYISSAKKQFDSVLYIDHVTWTDSDGYHTASSPDHHPDMKLAFYLNNRQENSNFGNNNWTVGTNSIFHEWVTMSQNDSLNYRISNNSNYDLNIFGYITFGPH